MSFNNVVIEVYEDEHTVHRNVILPTYSEDSVMYGTDRAIRYDLEQAAQATWESLGFSVHRMDGLEDLARGHGSVHCITKELKRRSS